MNSLSIYCDGGARGNPGPAAIAFVVFQNGEILYKFARRIGKATNNVAEYQAVIVALEWVKRWVIGCASHTPTTHSRPAAHNLLPVHFYLDSQLVVNQLNGLYKVKNQKLRQMVIKVKVLEREINLLISYHSIAREKNKIADSLINKILNGFTL